MAYLVEVHKQRGGQSQQEILKPCQKREVKQMKNIPLEIPGPEGGLFMSGAGLLLQEWLRLHSGFEVKIMQYVQICTTYYIRFSKLFVSCGSHYYSIRKIVYSETLIPLYFSYFSQLWVFGRWGPGRPN